MGEVSSERPLGGPWRIEAERDVLSTLSAYGHSLDLHDVERWVSLFTPDGVFAWKDITSEAWTRELVGWDALRAWMADEYVTRVPVGTQRHGSLDPWITSLDDAEARVRSSYIVVRGFVDRVELLSSGRYEDRLVRSKSGRWLIAERRSFRDRAPS
jgi:hypothetical protein